MLAVAALAIPTLATMPGDPDAGHETDLSVIVSIVLLVVFAASIPFSLSGGRGASVERPRTAGEPAWPLPLALGDPRRRRGRRRRSPRTCSSRRSSRPWPTFGMSEAFVGLVIVAIAGNAVENVVGVQAAAANKMELATASSSTAASRSRSR